jgi:uncharacterized membrane protein (GlpM family)
VQVRFGLGRPYKFLESWARMQLIFRFVVGGLIVSLFASFGDVVKPKSFAGLFAAAPSVALSTLGLTIVTNGKLYAAAEGRSMIAGAVGLFLYATVTMRLILKYRLHAGRAAICAIAVWFVCAVGVWLAVLR